MKVFRGLFLLVCAALAQGCASIGQYVQSDTDTQLRRSQFEQGEEIFESQIARVDGMDVAFVPTSREWGRREIVTKQLVQGKRDITLRRFASRVMFCPDSSSCDTEPYSAIWTEEGRYAVFLPKGIQGNVVIVSGRGDRVLTAQGKIVNISPKDIMADPKGFFAKHPSLVSQYASKQDRARVVRFVEKRFPINTVKPISGENYRVTKSFVQSAGISTMEDPRHRLWASGALNVSSTDFMSSGATLVPKVVMGTLAVQSKDRVGLYASEEEVKEDEEKREPRPPKGGELDSTETALAWARSR